MYKKIVMAIVVVVALVLYLVGMGIISAASLSATATESAKVDKLWLDLVAGVTTILALNAGAYLGLPETRFRLDFTDPETARLIATIVYALTIVAAFIIAAVAEYPHPSLTDMGATLIGFVTGVLSVFLGRD